MTTIPTGSPADHSPLTGSFDVGIIGGGSAAEALLRELAPYDLSVVVFEPDRVGGECPFVACMPSKSMLHDAGSGSEWADTVVRRNDVVNHLDDSGHRQDARDLGATIVSEHARIAGTHSVVAGTERFRCEHIVVATGATPFVPDIDGLDTLGDRRWSSADALIASDRPDRMLIVGGGVIACELAQIYAQFGTHVTVVDPADRPFPDLHERVGELAAETLSAIGVDLRYGCTVTATSMVGRNVNVTITGADGDNELLRADVVVIAAGRRPSTKNVGLETLGLDPTNLDVDHFGRIVGAESLWAIGDVAGGPQYTHIANRHAKVVGQQLLGAPEMTFDGAVVPSCVFLDPPIITVGPSPKDIAGDDDVIWAHVDVEGFPRQITDELPAGFLALAGRRSTRTLIAAHGIGPRFDEIIHALTIAIDGEVDLDTLARTIQPFPTVGEVLGVAFTELLEQVDKSNQR
jgi:pyruvate/2-oxoglutarate dehydrogenase complex dihydrolipoamide dehydrogenase (E3) component